MHAVAPSGDRLDDVAAAPDAAVADDLDAAADRVGHRRDEVERRRARRRAGGRRGWTGRSPRRRASAASTASSTVWMPLSTIGPSQHRAQPVDVVPRRARVELGVDVVRQRHRRGAVADVARPTTLAKRIGSLRTNAHVHAGCRAPSRSVPGPILGGSEKPAAHVALAPAEHGGVDGEHERLVAGGGGPLDHLLHEPAVAPRVHLEPQPSVADRARPPRSSGCSASTACTAGRPGSAARATASSPCGVGDAGEPGRREHERVAAAGRAEQRRRRVDLADAAQHPRAERRCRRRRRRWRPACARPRRRRRCSRTRRAGSRRLAMRRRSSTLAARASRRATRVELDRSEAQDRAQRRGHAAHAAAMGSCHVVRLTRRTYRSSAAVRGVSSRRYHRGAIGRGGGVRSNGPPC